VFNAGQVTLFDTSLTTATPFVLLRLAAGDIYLTTSATPGHPGTLASPAPDDLGRATPCILNWGQTSTGFDILGEADQVSSMVITAQNVRLPINTQSNNLPVLTFRGFLSEYLQSVTLQGPGASLYEFPPGQVAVYLTAPSGIDAEFSRHYIFRGLLYDFDVSGDNNIVVMRFIEDTRWDRAHPYPLSRKTYFSCPQENVGMHQPLNYGNFALWAHKDFPKDLTASKGPFDKNGPWFPVCANLGPAYQVLYLYHYSQNWHSAYTLGLSSDANHGVAGCTIYNSLDGQQWQCMTMAADGMAIVPHSAIAAHGINFAPLILDESDPGQLWPVSDVGMHDLRFWSNALFEHNFNAVALLLPTREIQTGRQGSTNLDSIFASVHRKRSAQHIIDGDRYSWFKDNVSGTGVRRIVYELGNYANMGAISSIKPVLLGRRRVGTGTLTWRAYLDYYAAAVGIDTGITDTGGLLINAFTSSGYFASAGTLTQVLASPTPAERWEFVQHDAAAPLGGQPMRIMLEWSKGTAADEFDIIQFGLMVEFSPSKQFIEYKERTDTRTVKVYDTAGRARRRSVDTITIEKVTANVEYQPNRHAYYAGLGIQADPTNFPGDKGYVGIPATRPNIIQNPAEILRHLIYYQGGGLRDDVNPAWPPIALSEFEYGSSVGRSFSKAEDNLDDLLRESAAPGVTDESFKLAVSMPTWSSVRQAALSVMASVPGLRLYRAPVTSNQDAGNALRASLCASFPLVGESPTYRRRISFRTDCINVAWSLLPQSSVINDLRMKYGYSTAKSTYCRELWAQNNVLEHGWPFNSRNSGSLESDASDPLAGTIGVMLEESYQRYGTRQYEMELPWVYRWHEALAIRNWLFRWRAFQRVRLDLLVRIGVSDLLPGDVFQLENDSDAWMQGHRFPLCQLPNAPMDWDGTTWLVERVTYQVGDNGDLMAQVRAIYNAKLGET